MSTNSTLLCIHRDPAELSLLKENGYELVTARSGSDGLRLLMSQSVDAVVLDYELSCLNGAAAVAAQIKKIKPQLPIVMLSDHLELTDGVLNSVDALVTKSDGPHFLWATVHFILNVKPAKLREPRLDDLASARMRRAGGLWDGALPFAGRRSSISKRREPCTIFD
jgi:DNA-binding response OmpR family regulator